MSGAREDAAVVARDAAIASVKGHAVLGPLAGQVRFSVDTEQRRVAPKGWLALDPAGVVWLHPKRRAAPAAWARVIGAALVCLGFGLVRRREPYALWELASFLVAEHFCAELKLGQLPEVLAAPPCAYPAGGAEGLLRQFCVAGCEPALSDWYGALGGGMPLFCGLAETAAASAPATVPAWQRPPPWRDLLADGIARGVGHALQIAGGVTAPAGAMRPPSAAMRARRRLIDHYPLLGALAASFDLEEDAEQNQRYGIRVAAIDVGARRIWINPAAGLKPDECLFVLAHELLHAGLQHASRRRGRDALLWNIACDFVINGWLVDMRLGSPPQIGVLFDPQFDGDSAEEVYDALARDIRRARKLATLRGRGAQDLIGEDEGGMFTDAETYCRRALAQGMERYDCAPQRGLLPAGLVEEIRSLSQPPIPWDVKLADWFDQRFPPPEPRRSYARPSRRQSATPEIARPSVLPPSEEARASRVFGVLLDTSGSMPPALLGKALGAIASYALAREVAMVRLICCDAQAYDSGWVEPERLLDRYSVRGRGGTVLQPGLERLRALAARGEFPPQGPVLVVTDGWCEDGLSTAMDHAFLLPAGRRLPFVARAPLFAVE